MATKRTIDDLQTNAHLFWPPKLAEKEKELSIIPRLIESQEKFIGILYVADSTPIVWQEVLGVTTGMPGNLFLKHLMVLSDVSGEKLQRWLPILRNLYADSEMTYTWRGQEFRYTFKSLGARQQWNNPHLNVDGPGLSTPQQLDDAMHDIAMLILHGGASVDAGMLDDVLERCTIGSLLGQKDELDRFVRQRYIWVSRITGGATANTMGQLAQAYVKERLQNLLSTWNFSSTTIPGVSENAGRTDISFDIIAESPTGTCCAIEVSFQVTTNSTIERKAGQARARQRLLHRHGHRIAYVIDGAGNFQRRSALSTICAHSDCTVTFTDKEISKLAKYLKTLEN